MELGLLALIVYTPVGQLVFGTAALPPGTWPLLALGAAGLLFAEEIRKLAVPFIASGPGAKSSHLE